MTGTEAIIISFLATLLDALGALSDVVIIFGGVLLYRMQRRIEQNRLDIELLKRSDHWRRQTPAS